MRWYSKLIKSNSHTLIMYIKIFAAKSKTKLRTKKVNSGNCAKKHITNALSVRCRWGERQKKNAHTHTHKGTISKEQVWLKAFSQR